MPISQGKANNISGRLKELGCPVYDGHVVVPINVEDRMKNIVQIKCLDVLGGASLCVGHGCGELCPRHINIDILLEIIGGVE